MMIENNMIKCCTDCKTTRTPLWRGGPAGPKTLCNACGIRYRKKKRVIESLNGRAEKKKDKTHSAANTAAKCVVAGEVDGNSSSNGCVNNGLSESFKMRLMVLGEEMLQRSASSSSFVVVKKKQRCQRRRKLKEEEQAAFSLMALSCGCVFA